MNSSANVIVTYMHRHIWSEGEYMNSRHDVILTYIYIDTGVCGRDIIIFLNEMNE